MVDSRAKGARAENDAKKILVKHTGLNWQRVPSSGALSVSHKLKGDLYIPEKKNVYCVEVKHYKADSISTKLLTSTNPDFDMWWEQAVREGSQIDREPLLLFKHDRSKFFVAYIPNSLEEDFNFLYYSKYNIRIAKLEDWLKKGSVFFIYE